MTAGAEERRPCGPRQLQAWIIWRAGLKAQVSLARSLAAYVASTREWAVVYASLRFSVSSLQFMSTEYGDLLLRTGGRCCRCQCDLSGTLWLLLGRRWRRHCARRRQESLQRCYLLANFFFSSAFIFSFLGHRFHSVRASLSVTLVTITPTFSTTTTTSYSSVCTHLVGDDDACTHVVLWIRAE